MALQPKVINLDQSAQGYFRILGGPPDSVSMRSGRVVLQPSEEIGSHNTEDYEELVLVLAGEGLFLLADADPQKFTANSVLYCPPMTEHNIKNTGSKPLHYIYVVAKAGCRLEDN